MARTRGAKDNKPRKKPAGKPPMRQSSPSHTPEPKATTVPAIERPPIPLDDFKSAIAADCSKLLHARAGTGGTVRRQPASVLCPGGRFRSIGLDPGRPGERLAVSFWLLGWGLTLLRVVPAADPVMDVGKRRAKDLAKPSYAIYEHYARQYLKLNPDNTVHVAAGVTALNGVGILPDLVEAIVKSRRVWSDQIRLAQQQQPAPAAGGA